MLRIITASRVAPRTTAPTPQAKHITANYKSLQVSQVDFKNLNRFYAANRLYVGNVPWTTTENELRDLFAEYGKVSEVKIPTDRETGRSKGFAFITMETNESGTSAASQLDGKNFGGRTLRVNEAREREANFGGGGGAGAGAGGQRSSGGFGNRGPRRNFNNDREDQ